MNNLRSILQRRRNQRGQGMTEYIIIVAFIAVVCIAVVMAFGKQLREYFFKTGDALARQESNVEIENKMEDVDMDD